MPSVMTVSDSPPPPLPSPNYPGDWCHIHGLEPLPEDYWRVCYECWHVYPSFEQYQADYVQHGVPPATPEEAHVCAWCAHDF
jgi:hypothetical protein